MKTEIEDIYGMKISQDRLEEELHTLAMDKPKRWHDTTRRLKDSMAFLSVYATRDRVGAFTFWIGDDLIEQAVSKRRPLAQLVLSALHRRLKRAFPENEIGFWLNIEGKQKDPMALHAHGLMLVDDPRLLADKRTRRRLSAEIRAALGKVTRHKMAARQVDFCPRPVIDLGWYEYATKQRRRRFYSKPVIKGQPPMSVGQDLFATSHPITAHAREFYSRARLIVIGITTGRIAKWTSKEWALVEPPSLLPSLA